jgi:hypothetical protein
MVPTNSHNNLAIGRRTKLTPERSGAQPWMSSFYAKEGFMGQMPDRYAVTPGRRIRNASPRGKIAARSGSRRNAFIRA